MDIRTATKDDIPAMAELLHELFAIEADFTPDYEVQVRGLARLMMRSDAAVFVAETRGGVVGMCSVQVLVSTAEGCEVGKLEDMVVGLGHRGRGTGAALLRAAEAWARARGLARLQLQADRDNHPALGFYRRQGWRPTRLIGWMKHL